MVQADQTARSVAASLPLSTKRPSRGNADMFRISQLIPLINPAPRRQCGCRFGLGFVRGELALIAGLELTVGDAADRQSLAGAEQIASDGSRVVVHDPDVFIDLLFRAGAGGQQQEAEGEAGHCLISRWWSAYASALHFGQGMSPPLRSGPPGTSQLSSSHRKPSTHWASGYGASKCLPW